MPGLELASVQELTTTLLKAVDEEGNVQDMTVVLNVVAVLERTDVTAEDLRVTRLGRVVNHIRRKIADVNKQLSKRLKNLVKEWRNKVPNGTTPTAVPLPLAQSAHPLSSSPLNPSSVGGGSLSTLSMSSSSASTSASEPIQHVQSNSQASEQNSSPVESGYGSLDPNSQLRPNSRESPNPPSSSPQVSTPSPTPPSTSTHSSRPAQPVSDNPARNRSLLMQRLSGVKRGTPNSKTDSSPSVSTQQQQEAYHHLNNTSSSINSHSYDSRANTGSRGVEEGAPTSQSSLHYSSQQHHHPPSPPVDNSLTSNARSHVAPLNLSRRDSGISTTLDGREGNFAGLLNDDETQSPWAAGLFMEGDFMNGSGWVPPQTPITHGNESRPSWLPETPANQESEGVSNLAPHTQEESLYALPAVTVEDTQSSSHSLNGTRELIERGSDLGSLNSRKRPRPSSSPVESELSAGVSSPAHKKHKPHSKRSHHRKLVVHIPLDRVHLKSQAFEHVADTRHEIVFECSKPRPQDGGIPENLIVSIPRSLLPQKPLVQPIKKEKTKGPKSDIPNSRTTNWSHDLIGKSHDSVDSPLAGNRQARDPALRSCDQDLKSWDRTLKESHDHPPKGHEGDTEPQEVKPDEVIVCTTCRQTVQPDWACPGLDGCLGCDGYWYNWTDHICGMGEEVTVMPYIYIEDVS